MELSYQDEFTLMSVIKGAQQRAMMENFKHRLDNSDICEHNHRGAETSVLANPAKHCKDKDKQTILAALQRAKEASCERLEITTGISHQSCSARISELLRDSRIKIVGRGVTISGKPCRLYSVV